MTSASALHVKVYRNTEQLKLSLEWKLQAVSNKGEYANLVYLQNGSELEICMNDTSGLLFHNIMREMETLQTTLQEVSVADGLKVGSCFLLSPQGVTAILPPSQ